MALQHEEKDYECPILSKACPFINKQFIQKIELGQQKPKEFMDEIMETVISDLNKPLKSNSLLRIEKTLSHELLGCTFITGFLTIFSIIFALNFFFGIGKYGRIPLI